MLFFCDLSMGFVPGRPICESTSGIAVVFCSVAHIIGTVKSDVHLAWHGPTGRETDGTRYYHLQKKSFHCLGSTYCPAFFVGGF